MFERKKKGTSCDILIVQYYKSLRERPHSHKFYYNSILLLVIFNLLLCLIYTLSFISGMYVYEKT